METVPLNLQRGDQVAPDDKPKRPISRRRQAAIDLQAKMDAIKRAKRNPLISDPKRKGPLTADERNLLIDYAGIVDTACLAAHLSRARDNIKLLVLKILEDRAAGVPIRRSRSRKKSQKATSKKTPNPKSP